MTGFTGTEGGRGLIEARRDRVSRLRIQKATISEITEILNDEESPFRPVSKSTIGRDVVEIKKLWKERIGKTGEEFLSETAAELDEISRRLWGQFFTTPQVDPASGYQLGGLRSSILNSIAAIPAKKIKLGQSLGIIAKAAEKVEISVEIVEDVRSLILQSLSRMTVEAAQEFVQALEAVIIEDPKLAERLVVDFVSSQ